MDFQISFMRTASRVVAGTLLAGLIAADGMRGGAGASFPPPVRTLPAGPGYLVMVGPAPIRFSDIEIVPVITNTPPPPINNIEMKSKFTNAPVAASVLTTPILPSVITDFPMVLPLPTNDAPPVVEMPPAEPTVSPQTVLQYFMQTSTTGAAATVVAPIGFLPPRVEPRASSSATYSTSPP